MLQEQHADTSYKEIAALEKVVNLNTQVQVIIWIESWTVVDMYV